MKSQTKARPGEVVEFAARRGRRVLATTAPAGPRRGGRAIVIALALSLAAHGAAVFLFERTLSGPPHAAARPLEVVLVTAAEPAAVPSPPVAAPAPPRAVAPPARPAAPAAPRAEAPVAAAASPVREGETAAPPLAGAEAAAAAAAEVAAAYLHNPPPPYPLAARRQGQQGLVLLRALVGREGRVEQLVLARSSGHAALDEAALSGVRPWIFAPARRGTEPVAGWVEIPVRFQLEAQN